MKAYSYTPKTMTHDDSYYDRTYQSSVSRSHSPVSGHLRKKSTPVDHLELAKRNIDQAIMELQDKRQLMNDACKEIYSVNSEIYRELKTTPSVSTQIYELREPLAHSQIYAQEKKSARDTHTNSYSVLGNDSLSLQKKLNEEMKKNNELIYRLSKAQQVNKSLRESGSYGGGNEELLRQNAFLKKKLQNLSSLPYDLFNELEELKRQNQELRQQTVRLLRKNDRY